MELIRCLTSAFINGQLFPVKASSNSPIRVTSFVGSASRSF